MRYLIIRVVMVATLSFTTLEMSARELPTQGKHGANRRGAATIPFPRGSAVGTMELAKLWEEEKLARDVYNRFAQGTGAAVFRKIAQAESQHMRAVAQLANEPDWRDVPGVFVNAEYQQLYHALLAAGQNSPLDALRVGAKIEEVDIADLKRIISSTNDPRTQQVLGNLQRASGNHLRAFTSQLAANGATYSPQVLSQAEYDQILRFTLDDEPRDRGKGTAGPGADKGKARR